MDYYQFCDYLIILLAGNFFHIVVNILDHLVLRSQEIQYLIEFIIHFFSQIYLTITRQPLSKRNTTQAPHPDNHASPLKCPS